MKKVSVLVLIVALLTWGSAFAGASRVVDYPSTYVGVDTVILANADSGFATQIVIPLTDKNQTEKSYTGFFGYFYAPNIAVYLDTQIVNSGKVDTAIVTITAGYGMRRDTVKVDTLLPPDTCVFEWWNDNDFVKTGAVTLIDADSSSDSAWAGGVYVPTDKPSRRLMYYDNLYIDVYESDTAGAGDTGIFLNQYRVRLIDDK